MKKKLMTTKYVKENGVHYTPKDLSMYMANLLVNEYLKNNKNKKIKVLDPACGDGELLLALAIILKENNIDFEMYGIDTNSDELIIAKERLNEINVNLLTKNVDYIDNYNNFKDFDLVIANPPYVRTQNMEQSMRINKNNFEVNGRFDLYQLFINAITKSLKNDGIICIITSNKFMFNKSGEKTREIFQKNYELKLIVDLGDSKMFEASVLPSIVLGKKVEKNIQTEALSIKVYETDEQYTSRQNIFDALKSLNNCIVQKDGHNYKIENGIIALSSCKEPWAIVSSDDMFFIKKINDNKYCYLSEWANIKVGIKTTADKVFLKKSLLDFENVENNLVYEMIYSKNVNKWIKKDEPNKYILYPYELNDNKQYVIDLDIYPKTKKYLEKNEEILKGRKYFEGSSKKWYEIWVCHSLLEFLKPKIVVPDISSESKFLFDNTGKLVDGNCYWITLKDDVPEDYIYLILGLCNSSFMEKYHDLVFQNKLYSGKRRYVSQYLNKYPMINPNTLIAKKIIKLVKEILSNNNSGELIKLEIKINELIDDYWREITNE